MSRLTSFTFDRVLAALVFLAIVLACALTPMQTDTWSAPLASPYGLHLVWVHQHEPERLPSLDAVRETVALALMQERAARNLQTGLARLRDLYEARVEGSL